MRIGLFATTETTPPRWWPLDGTLATDFLHRRYMRSGVPVSADTAFSVGRASEIAADDSLGKWHWFVADEPAITDRGLFVSPASTNHIADTRFSSAVPGVVGADAVLPVGWAFTSPTGLTWEILGIGADDGYGLAFVDVRLSGTNASGSTVYPQVRFADGLSLGAPGTDFTLSSWVTEVTAPAPPQNRPVLQMIVRRSGGSSYTYPGITIATAARARWSRVHQIGANFADELAVETACIQQNVLTSESVDVSFRLAGMQLEESAAPTAPIRTDGVSQSRAGQTLVAHLPAGTHDVTVDRDGATSLVFPGLSGSAALPVTGEWFVTGLNARPSP